jgi:acetylglutamate synthase
MVYIENLVPKDHLLRKINQHVDFSFIKEVTNMHQNKMSTSALEQLHYTIKQLQDKGIKNMLVINSIVIHVQIEINV